MLLLSEGGRGNFVFGPNILYRVFSILTLLVFFGLYSKGKVSLIKLLFVYILCAYALYKTGSRGSLISMIIVLVAMVHCYLGKIKLNKFIFFLPCAAIFVVIIYQLNSDMILQSRFSNFDYENNLSLALRINPHIAFFSNPLDYLLTFGIDYDQFYQQFGHEQFPYPHNIFLELIFFYGIFGAFFSAFIIISMMKATKKVINSDFNVFCLFYYISMIIFFGALFSGSLLDNYVFLSAAFLLKWLENRSCNKK
ncbi:hypothetical protein GCM10027342_14720 [Photobacterium alginatilyticum]